MNVKIRKQDSWVCSKEKLLNSIGIEYEAKQLRDDDVLKGIFHEFDSNQSGVLDFDQFEKLCRKIDPEIEAQKIQEIFQDAIEKSESEEEQTVLPDIFSMVAIQFILDNFGTRIFCKFKTQLYSKANIGLDSKKREAHLHFTTTSDKILKNSFKKLFQACPPLKISLNIGHLVIFTNSLQLTILLSRSDQNFSLLFCNPHSETIRQHKPQPCR